MPTALQVDWVRIAFLRLTEASRIGPAVRRRVSEVQVTRPGRHGRMRRSQRGAGLAHIPFTQQMHAHVAKIK
jgi:hypothetical protein